MRLSLFILLNVVLQSLAFISRNLPFFPLAVGPFTELNSFNRQLNRGNRESYRTVQSLSSESPLAVADGVRHEAQQALNDQGIDLEDLLDLRHFTMTHRSAKRSSDASVGPNRGAVGDFHPTAEKPVNAASASKRKRAKLMRPIEMGAGAGEQPRAAALDGVTLKAIVSFFADPSVSPFLPSEGFNLLYKATHLRCFLAENRPSLSSALALLRKPTMQWARDKVADLYTTLRSAHADR